jgi:hypothetical protein
MKYTLKTTPIAVVVPAMLAWVGMPMLLSFAVRRLS